MCLQIKDVIVKYHIKNTNSEMNKVDFKILSSFIYSQPDLKSFQHCVLPFRWYSTLAAFPEGFS